MPVFSDQLHLLGFSLGGSVVLRHAVAAGPVRLSLLLVLSAPGEALPCQLYAHFLARLVLPRVVRGGDLGRIYKEAAVIDPVVAGLHVVLPWAIDANWDAHLRVDALQDLGAFVNDGLHLEKAGSRQEADDVLELQGHVTCVAESKKLLEHLGAFDD